MTEPIDLSILDLVADLADTVGEEVKVTPDQFRAIVAEMRANRESLNKLSTRLIEISDAHLKLRMERDGLASQVEQTLLDRDRARWDLGQIVSEFGDYESLLQSREICDTRMHRLANVRTLHAELTSEKYAWDHANNAAFHMAMDFLGHVLDGEGVNVRLPDNPEKP